MTFFPHPGQIEIYKQKRSGVTKGYYILNLDRTGRGKICVVGTTWCRWKRFTDVHLKLNLGFRSKNIVFPYVGFHLKSGFKKILCSKILVFTLILDSQKYCVHTFFLYCLFKHFLCLPNSGQNHSLIYFFNMILYCGVWWIIHAE